MYFRELALVAGQTTITFTPKKQGSVTLPTLYVGDGVNWVFRYDLSGALQAALPWVKDLDSLTYTVLQPTGAYFFALEYEGNGIFSFQFGTDPAYPAGSPSSPAPSAVPLIVSAVV
jgi:hypothetical protein